MTRRRKDRTDDNQGDIVKELEKHKGITVEVGKDDILVGYQGRTYWYEIKNPNVRGKDGNPRPSAIKDDQKRILREFTGHYKIVFTAEEILADIGYFDNGYGCFYTVEEEPFLTCCLDDETMCTHAEDELVNSKTDCKYWRRIKCE